MKSSDLAPHSCAAYGGSTCAFWNALLDYEIPISRILWETILANSLTMHNEFMYVGLMRLTCLKYPC